jgi:hypothetical protein
LDLYTGGSRVSTFNTSYWPASSIRILLAMGYQRTLEQELDDKASLIFLPGDRIYKLSSLKSILLCPSDDTIHVRYSGSYHAKIPPFLFKYRDSCPPPLNIKFSLQERCTFPLALLPRVLLTIRSSRSLLATPSQLTKNTSKSQVNTTVRFWLKSSSCKKRHEL